MAGKKKKKPVANPARGFATVSLPSKPKTSKDEQDITKECASETGTSISSPPGDSLARGGRPDEAPEADGKEIQDMSPEELERHLEEAELQSFCDEHAVRIKSDASRQAIKLKNERRQLRQQAERATMTGLTDLLVDEILTAESSKPPVTVSSSVSSANVNHNDKDVLLKLWTLQELLRHLDMPAIDDALAHVLRESLGFTIPVPSESVFGLREALSWYAENKTAAELPDYETGRIGNVNDHDSEAAAILNSNHEPAVNDLASDQNSDTVHSSPELPVDSDTGSEEDEEDDDPDLLVDRWLQFQATKFELEHNDDLDKHQQKRRIAKLLVRIRRIESDVLFDEAIAQQRFQPILKDLQIEYSQNRRKATVQEDSRPNKGQVNEPINSEALDDDDQLLTGMFAEDAAASNEPGIREDETSITIHDFGMWTGVHPRRVLEEAAADVVVKGGVTYKVLSSTPHSARLQVDIHMRSHLSADDLARQTLPEGVSFVYARRSWCLRMEQVATKNALQSEAFLATLCLFLLMSSGLASFKNVQRLPKAWRNMLSDLDLTRLELVAKEDVQNLRHLRDLIRSVERPTASRAANSKQDVVQTPTSHAQPRNFLLRLSSEEAKETWLARARSAPFKKMQPVRESLPVFQYKNEILETFEQNQIVIVCADTGAGKSTQVPSYILEEHLSHGEDYNILVTQPRRISAISIARRVSAELGEANDAVGTARSLIGYAIRLESKTSQATRVTFATTGVLLRMLQDAPNLDHIDCLILDEVHERTMDLDLLFIALKQLRLRRSSLKIVLMSATVNAAKFSSYFDNAPVLDIPGRTFPVEVGFLEDAIEQTRDIQGPDGSSFSESATPADTEDSDDGTLAKETLTGLENYSTTTKRIISQYDSKRIDYELIVKLSSAIATKPKYIAYSSAILIFMPGIAEIRRLHSLLLSHRVFSTKWTIHMLHSSFSTQELEQAFMLPPPGHRKIVIATNIAETGVTIPDVTAVIDTCKEKVMRFDERRQLSRLTEGSIARASARQRKGRAARVREGLCFHLVTRHRYETKMPEQTTPEMLRLSLQEPILRVKIWKLGPIEEVLASAIDPPNAKNVRRAAMKLQNVGAIDTAESLTPLGSILAKLPLDVALGKLAVYGVIFQCLDVILTVIATFSIKSIFVENAHSTTSSRAAFARGESDFLTTYNAYLGWRKASKAGTGQHFCHKYHLSQFQLQQLQEQKVQLLVYLADARLIALEPEETADLHRARNGRLSSHYEVPSRYDKLNSDAVVSAVIAAALYPNLLRREGHGYRNVFTNQQLQLASTSINKLISKPPTWLCYLEASQAKSGKLNAFHSSRVTQAMLLLLLGDADFSIFSGVVEIDRGRVRFSLREWKDMLVLQRLRAEIRRIVDSFLARPQSFNQTPVQWWLDLVAKILDSQGLPQSRSPPS